MSELPMVEGDQTCRTCRFSTQWVEADGGTHEGLCLRYPPVLDPSISGDDIWHDDPLRFVHPAVVDSSQCGEWQAKESRAPQQPAPDLVESIPSVPDIRARISELVRRTELLRGLLKVALRKDRESAPTGVDQ